MVVVEASGGQVERGRGNGRTGSATEHSRLRTDDVDGLIVRGNDQRTGWGGRDWVGVGGAAR